MRFPECTHRIFSKKEKNRSIERRYTAAGNKTIFFDHSGITLIELIISIAIMTIVLAMVVLLINTALRGYRRTSVNADLQMEAQTAMDQLSILAMEASEIEQSSNITQPGDVKYLMKTPTNYYVVFYKAGEHKLYLIPAATGEEADSVNPTATEDTAFRYLLAEYVQEFKMTHPELTDPADSTKHYEDKKTVNIVISFQLGEEPIYTISKRVKERNAK